MSASWIDTRTVASRAPLKYDTTPADAKFKSSEFLADDQLIHLKSYRYQAVDKSIIGKYILQHYWNYVVELLPRWLAPNAVTLLGFFAILINIGFLAIWMPDLVGPGPSWLYYSFAIGLWVYSTMDNIDGKQARRTGSSSPLGELFDHGIDSLNCTLASLCETAAMGLGPTPEGAFTALIPCLPMFFSTWETYHSHVLYLGYFSGPTEGLIIACALMGVSGYYGPHIWGYKIADTIGFHEIFEDKTFRQLWVPFLAGAFVFGHLPACVYHVVQARRKDKLPVLPVFLEWTPMILFSTCTGAWVLSPYSYVLQHNHLMLLCLTLSFVFGRMTTKIILAHLTRQPFPYWTAMLIPLVGGAVMSNLPYMGLPAVSASTELWYMRGYFAFATIAYFRWALLIIDGICSYLGIQCLRIKTPPKPVAGVLNGVTKERAA